MLKENAQNSTLGWFFNIKRGTDNMKLIRFEDSKKMENIGIADINTETKTETNTGIHVLSEKDSFEFYGLIAEVTERVPNDTSFCPHKELFEVIE